MMKQITLTAFLAIAAISITSVDAQNKKPRPEWLDETTTVFVLGNAGENELVIKESALEYFRKNHRTGFQTEKMPRFLITDKSAKAVFAIGGFVDFRTAYDFNNVMNNVDFVPYDITMRSTSTNNQRLLMDASTSRLYFKTVVKTKNGPLEGFVSTDFRGAGNTLRLREAYVSYIGFTLGQTTTTFADLNASFNTIDFQGPNGYTYGRNLLARYEHKWKNGISAALALEYPNVSATYGLNNSAIYQRVPDIPAYVQYAWKGGHIRASGIIRNMFYLNEVKKVDLDAIGWGAQLSGSFDIGKVVTLYGDVVYGKGITPYIQDLQGVGMDLMSNPMGAGQMSSVETMSWLVGAQFNITSRLPLTVGYSQVSLFDKNSLLTSSDYKIGQYVVANMFYNISRYWNVGVEYLYGARTDAGGSFGQSHRIQAAVQFNF